MAKTRSDIRLSVRDKLNAWPDGQTTLAEELDASETAIDLTAVSFLAEQSLIEVDSELMQVVSIASLTATVIRGVRGTTAATHSNGATAKFYPKWGWSDAHLNRLITKAIQWLGEGMCWTLVPTTNTWLSGFREFGVPEGAVYPTGNIVKRIEAADSEGTYHEINGWRHVGDRIIINHKLTDDLDVRLWTQTKQADITSDATQLSDEKWAECLELYTAGRCLDELLANRSRYMEYSATLNDRASTLDELQRAAYYFFNQSTILRNEFSRPGLSGFAPRIKPGASSIKTDGED